MQYHWLKSESGIQMDFAAPFWVSDGSAFDKAEHFKARFLKSEKWDKMSSKVEKFSAQFAQEK